MLKIQEEKVNGIQNSSWQKGKEGVREKVLSNAGEKGRQGKNRHRWLNSSYQVKGHAQVRTANSRSNAEPKSWQTGWVRPKEHSHGKVQEGGEGAGTRKCQQRKREGADGASRKLKTGPQRIHKTEVMERVTQYGGK